MRHSRDAGAIPILLIVAIAFSAAIGGLIGFQLGDGSFFSFGVGFGIVFFVVAFLGPQIRKVLDLRDRINRR